MKRILAAFLGLSLLVLAACETMEGLPTTAAATTTAAGNAATDGGGDASLGAFETRDMAGDPVTKAVFADYDLTLVNIWATWCPPCVAEIPDLGELVHETRPRGVNIVGILLDGVNQKTLEADESAIGKAEKIMRSSDAEYTVILPDAVLMSSLLAGVSSIPTTVFVDRDGNVVGKPVVGARSKAKWSAEIDNYLALIEQ